MIEYLSGQMFLISSTKGGGSNLTPFHAAIFLSSIQHPSKSPCSYLNFGDSGRQANDVKETTQIPKATKI